MNPASIKETAKLQIMHKEYRYKLDSSSRKFICPSCGKKTFVRFIDSLTKEYLQDNLGRCDREINCGYFKYPNKNKLETTLQAPKVKETTYHDYDLVEKTMDYKGDNNFLNYLRSLFKEDIVQKIKRDYKIGTADFFYNGAIFWQIDDHEKVRGGKIIQYKEDGHRTKNINWVHVHLLKQKKIDEFHLSQCLFGLHLIQIEKDKPIAIVESEKTACIMSVTFPAFLWLATGSLQGINFNKLLPIKNRKIILYPDTSPIRNEKSAYSIWTEKAEYFKQLGFDIHVSDLLENLANEDDRERGFDLADYVNYPKK
ncbi:hypothetical protein EDL98_09590 [Ornithobacterium rhinotracheale]|nr:hypothetical protein [Ornithobacterium rhinotracheale]